MKTMKISMIAAAIALLTLGAADAAAQSKKFTLNDAVGKNQFVWKSDAPLEQIKGTAEGVTGSLTIDHANIANTRGTISAQVSTMKTGNGTRDGHLKSAQWLDAAKYPAITFTITSVSNVKTSGNVSTGTATGKFTMHGVTKDISVPFKLTYLEESAKTRQRAAGDLVTISADFNIKLADFNVAGTKGTVGSKVGEQIQVTAQLFGSSAQ